MPKMIVLVAPDAPLTSPSSTAHPIKRQHSAIRFGMLDNSKGNADHLLRFIADGIQEAMAVKSVLSLRKDNAAKGAPAAVIDRLADETDFVITAMAD